MTLTLNPLMGNLSSTYSVRASPKLALSSRFDFNFYSYESGLRVGAELWRPSRDSSSPPDRQEEVVHKSQSRQTRSSGKTLTLPPAPENDINETAGVLKARISDTGEMALLWEGRIKELVYGCGATLDFRKREGMVRGVGVEVGYSS